MSLSSPVGTVHTWRFTPTDTLLDNVSLGIGAVSTWTVPFHDGDGEYRAAGARGGQFDVDTVGGYGGFILGMASIAAGTVLTIGPGSAGGGYPAGWTKVD